LPSFQFRTLSGHHSGLFSYYLFGNKIAHVMQDGRVDFSFAVFNMVQSAQIHRAHFNLLWNRASPLQISDSAQERSIQIQI
jgi:hypothetical protein